MELTWDFAALCPALFVFPQKEAAGGRSHCTLTMPLPSGVFGSALS